MGKIFNVDFCSYVKVYIYICFVVTLAGLPGFGIIEVIVIDTTCIFHNRVKLIIILIEPIHIPTSFR